MPFKANDSLTEQIAQYLEQRIIQGEMKPGERIQELRIAAELEVSRGSVREALLLLQRRHLVEIYPRRGAVVSSIQAHEVQAFFDLWLMLLGRVIGNLARNWQNDDLARFIELTAQMGKCRQQGDQQGFYNHGVAFLRSLYAYADNRYLRSTLEDLLPLTQRCLYAILRAGQARIEHTHCFLERLLKSVIERDEMQLDDILMSFGASYCELAQTSADALEG